MDDLKDTISRRVWSKKQIFDHVDKMYESIKKQPIARREKATKELLRVLWEQAIHHLAVQRGFEKVAPKGARDEIRTIMHEAMYAKGWKEDNTDWEKE